MSLSEDRDLLPYEPDFDITKRGYNTRQVKEYYDHWQSEQKLMAADRDSALSQAQELAKQLESTRSQVDALRGQIDRLALPPTTLEGLSERLQHMLKLAQDEKVATLSRAEAEASHIRDKAEADATQLRQRWDTKLAELEARRLEMEAEHRSVIDKAQADADLTVNTARQVAARLDAESEQRRTTVEEDFEIAMASRRTESMRALAEQEATSKGEAERRVREATEEANRRRHEAITEATARLQEATDEAHRRVREATEEANRRITHAAQRVAALRQLRTRIAEQLGAARDLIADAHVQLADAAPILEPLPEERKAPAPSPAPKPAAPAPVIREAEVGPPREHWEAEDLGQPTEVLATVRVEDPDAD